jgi:hypothetical protein
VTLGRALGSFEQLDAPLWVGKTRRELDRTVMRRLVGELTETEDRIAALVAQGRKNRRSPRPCS